MPAEAVREPEVAPDSSVLVPGKIVADPRHSHRQDHRPQHGDKHLPKKGKG